MQKFKLTVQMTHTVILDTESIDEQALAEISNSDGTIDLAELAEFYKEQIEVNDLDPSQEADHSVVDSVAVEPVSATTTVE